MRHLHLTAVLIAACSGTVFGGHEVRKPNVLFIIADDLGIGDLQCYGNPHVDTPVLNSQAASGVRFTDHYAPSPLCAPARAGFLTGRFNHRTGAIDVPSNRGLDRITLSEKTFGDYFRSAGYVTSLVGKWHNGLYCRDHLPHQRGFDSFFGFPNGGQDYWKWNLQRNDAVVPNDGRYLTDVLNDEAVDFIKASAEKGKPFALFLAHHVPHVPLQAPEKLVRKYRQRLGKGGNTNVAIIYAMIEAMDTGLGRVFQTIRDAGEWERTVIVFTSDNGAQLGRYQGGTTVRYHAGYSGNKGDVGEQGIRVPAIVAWPGQIPKGRVIKTPIHGCDWLPTLYSLAVGGEPVRIGNFDGLNIMPMLLGKQQPELNDRELSFQKNRYRPAAHSDAAIRQGRWKLVWPGATATMKKDSARDNPSYLRGVVNPHWEMPLDRELGPVPTFTVPRPQLFDLVADPAELNDVASGHPDVVQQLTDKHDAWFDDVMTDWKRSRKSIIDHDKAYWKDRRAPDPAALFKDFWLWNRAAQGTDPETADPLKVFRGYWSQPVP
ncbi:sulfatase-like hydrolase/transferase [bacterium]|nr:sulfatase-like hydrolase/transferase [bacterium]